MGAYEHLERQEGKIRSAYSFILKYSEITVFTDITKGQTKFKRCFQADVSSKKQTNKFYFATMTPQVDLFSFVFGGN